MTEHNLRLRAPAKINLGLALMARRPDGYHDIETIFLPIRLFDDLAVRPGSGQGVRLSVGGAPLPGGRENLIVRAAHAISEALGIPPSWEIELTKRIPIAAGLGGGSSDAASTLLAIQGIVGRSLSAKALAALAAGLGADVPFFLDPKPAFGRAIGDELEAIPEVPEMAWVLVALPFAVSTPWAYQIASARLTLPRARSSIAALLGPLGLRSNPPNDLETVSSERHPQIAEARRALTLLGAEAVGMSGSGPTVYGRFADLPAARVAAELVSLPGGARAFAVTSPGSDSEIWEAEFRSWGVAKR